MKNKELIIFDMDGLLVDTEVHYRDGWIAGAKELGIDLDGSIVASWVGKGITFTTDYLDELTGSEEITNKIRENRERYFYQQMETGKLHLKRGAKDLIVSLYENGYKLGLATSTAEKRSIDILKHFDLYKYFTYKIFGDKVENVKPYPDLYDNIIEQANMEDRKKALVIEDSLTGAKAAERAGINVLLIPDNSFHDDFFTDVPKNVLKQFKDLIEVKEYLL